MKIYIKAKEALSDLLAVQSGQKLYGTISGYSNQDGSGAPVSATVSLPGSNVLGNYAIYTPQDLTEVVGLYNDMAQGTGDDSDTAIISLDLQIGLVAGAIVAQDPTVLTQPLPGNDGGVVTDSWGDPVVNQ